MQIRNLPKLAIPFYSQKVSEATFLQDGFLSYEEALSWEDRGCGIASLRMVVDAFLMERGESLCLRHGAMIHKGLEENAYKENAGWIHQGLVELAAGYGIVGVAHRGQTIETLALEIEKGKPCIASVTPRFLGGQLNENGEIRGTGGHLVVAFGTLREDATLKAFVVHHPSCFEGFDWPAMDVDTKRFEASFSGNFISF